MGKISAWPDSSSTNSIPSTNESDKGEKKKLLRLFGFELDIDDAKQVRFKAEADSLSGEGGGEKLSSDSIESDEIEKKQGKERCPVVGDSGSNGVVVECRKYGCEFCFKEFASSQALGGHQNAHKVEMMKKKRLEVQAREANGVGCFCLQPLIKSHGSTTAEFSWSSAPPWFYDPSRCRVPEFMVFGESHGGFKPLDCIPPTRFPAQQGGGSLTFSLVQQDSSKTKRFW